MELKYKKNDILEILTWDVGDEHWEYGLIRILDYNENYPHAKQGSYETEPIRVKKEQVFENLHPVTFIRICAQSLHNSCFVRYIGNTEEDETLKVLYGSKQTAS